jgi:hypothetical protein
MVYDFKPLYRIHLLDELMEQEMTRIRLISSSRTRIYLFTRRLQHVVINKPRTQITPDSLSGEPRSKQTLQSTKFSQGIQLKKTRQLVPSNRGERFPAKIHISNIDTNASRRCRQEQRTE